ncbi:hypothetical protein [Domibacillus enclensis]|uniref:DNA-binding protein n=1 Tax=Domibacillus enclensis TaxID=1017273 RepID=A0A1N6TQ48_9BACI|nr:hypothetical protein [Domibacillus enclensis]OXS78330.1 DNA-binding protein [Domibacillus enclensis]SIQ55433.1 hypothetical protein SAMN05443094_10344 [Domibacillus enclensis]
MSLFLGIGIAVAGYFIGDGLKNWKHPSEKNFFDHFKTKDQPELIEAGEVHRFIGTQKGDIKAFLEEHPDIPSIKINRKIYFSRSRLREWLAAQQLSS